MRINTFIERPDGTAEFTADMTEKELHMLAEIGINVLIQNGIQIVDQTKTTLVKEPEGVQ